MRVNEGYFEGVGGLKLFYKTWEPDETPRAVLVIIHGAGEHSGRYQNLIDTLVPAGYVLASYDQRGHGRSEGRRGHINSWKEYRKDLDLFFDLIEKLYPDQNKSIYGHSMGAMTLLDYQEHSSRDLTSAIVSGNALMPTDAAPPLLVMIAKALSWVMPKMLLQVKLEGSSLSRDPEVARSYMEDPLVHWKRSVRWGTEALKTLKRINKSSSKFNLPVMCMHGEKDPLLAVEGAHQFFNAVKIPDKVLHIYPNGLHEPHNDLYYQKAVNDVREWLDKHH